MQLINGPDMQEKDSFGIKRSTSSVKKKTWKKILKFKLKTEKGKDNIGKCIE